MITLRVYGQDIYLIEKLSGELHKPLVDCFKCSEDELNFVACESFFIHNGQEQTSYYLEIVLEISKEYKAKLTKAFEILKKHCQNYSINLVLKVRYIEAEFVFVNKEYPTYMTKDNMVQSNQEDEEDFDKPYSEEELEKAITSLREFSKQHPELSGHDDHECHDPNCKHHHHK